MSRDQTLWVEILSRQDEVLARHKLHCGAEGVIRIGRGYDSDVILDDPFVAASHVRVSRDENGALVADDLGSANGMYTGDDRRRVPRVVLDGTRVLRIGRTRLRVREKDHAVEPERIVRRRMPLWPPISLVAAGLLGWEALTMWLSETSDQHVAEYLGALLATALVVAAWSMAWAVAARIFSGRARFARHLLIAGSGLFAFLLFTEVTAYGAFAFSLPALITYRYVAQWLLAAYIVFLHLQQLSRSRELGRARVKLRAAVVTGLALTAICMQALFQWEASAASDRETFLRDLKPPAFAFIAPHTDNRFFADAAKLKEALDRARSDPPGRGWSFGSDEDG